MFRFRARVVVACTIAATALFGLGPAAAGQEKAQRPKVTVKATPPISFTPARVSFTIELKGGADDYQDFYCPTVMWEWGDGTESEATQDCDPYEPGTSTIKRRYTATHEYRESGRFTVVARLKREGKTIVATNVTVTVRPGAMMEPPY